MICFCVTRARLSQARWACNAAYVVLCLGTVITLAFLAGCDRGGDSSEALPPASASPDSQPGTGLLTESNNESGKLIITTQESATRQSLRVLEAAE
ncbi:MAG: hypothetical protein KDA96_09965 [Planctomycetaceae bacterium]|nr:hypothetical protein [Planctomycetaceae bacterium]